MTEIWVVGSHLKSKAYGPSLPPVGPCLVIASRASARGWTRTQAATKPTDIVLNRAKFTDFPGFQVHNITSSSFANWNIRGFSVGLCSPSLGLFSRGHGFPLAALN